jgi:propionyl-CoA carboxylase alpha chain
MRSDRQRIVRLGDLEFMLEVARDEDRFVVCINGQEMPHILSSRWQPGDPLWSGQFDARPVGVQVRPVLNGFDLMHRGVEVRAHVFSEREAAVARLMPVRALVDGGKAVRCPMPGLVIAVAVAEGQEVKVGETLAVVEAMKMENVLRAERDGVVRTIRVKPGDSLAVDAVILEFA